MSPLNSLTRSYPVHQIHTEYDEKLISDNRTSDSEPPSDFDTLLQEAIDQTPLYINLRTFE